MGARCKTKHCTTMQKKKMSSLVTLLNSRSRSGKNDELLRKCSNIDGKENIRSKDRKIELNNNDTGTILHEKRRLIQDGDEITHSPKKKLRPIIWPNKVTDVSYPMSGLASLFGDLVASCDNEKSTISLNSNFATTTMVAC